MQDWRISKQKEKILFEMKIAISIRSYRTFQLDALNSSLDETVYSLFVGSGGRTIPETPNERLRTQKRNSIRMGVLYVGRL